MGTLACWMLGCGSWMLGCGRVRRLLIMHAWLFFFFLKPEEMVVNTANSLAKHGYLNDVVDRVTKSQRRWLLVVGGMGVVAVAALRNVFG